MNPVTLDGKSLAKKYEDELKFRVAQLIAKTHAVPILAAIIVGNNPSSVT